VLQESRYIQWNHGVREIRFEFGSRIAGGRFAAAVRGLQQVLHLLVFSVPG
jgi:hypothetical protein